MQQSERHLEGISEVDNFGSSEKQSGLFFFCSIFSIIFFWACDFFTPGLFVFRSPGLFIILFFF